MNNEKDLEIIRHGLSHVMAAAVKELYPGVLFAIGPAIDNGFYYDFDFVENAKGAKKENMKNTKENEDKRISENDLAKIEKRMREIIKKGLKFEKSELKIDEAIAKEKKSGQVYKQELIEDLKKQGDHCQGGAGKKVSYYKLGEFEDLCRGPHVASSGKLKSAGFKLMKLAGAYWRGDEKRPMLTRIYGVAFADKKELEDYLKMMEEVEKRDHKKLGKELGLLMFHETAPGMPYWLPKGLVLYKELENYWRIEHAKLGYKEIMSPLVNKSDLWKISGHWDHYKDDMFIADMGENEVYGIKPMNCPNAMLVFKNTQISYKDLPLRLSDTDRLHRYERSGTLNGLLRCRSFQQDDSHNFITEEMIGSEYEHIMEICKNFYGIFGLEYKFRLGTRPKGFLGDKQTWDKAEEALKKILKKSEKEYTIAEGDGAFYGPKIDIVMKDCLGRDWQMGTMQLDFQLPRRFDLEYVDKDGQKKTPVVIHRVIYGSLERFIGILIEHYAGAFPVWLSPVQVKIISVGEKHIEFCQKLAEDFKKENIRVEVDGDNETVGNKIRKATSEKIPYVLVIGDREMESARLAVRDRGSREAREIDKEEFIKEVKNKISARS